MPTPRLPFRSLEPTFFSGLLDDPLLLLRIRPLGRSLLFDCGQIHHLAKRVLRSLQAVFISHAHMDHFMGLDTLVRHIHVAPRTVEIYGPPGLAAKTAHRLQGYDWNLTEPTWCTLRVREVHPGRLLTWVLPGAEGFVPRHEGEEPRRGRLIFENRHLRVEAEICDHKIPVLIYRIDEKPIFAVDEERLEAAGLVRGPWLKELKRRFHQGDAGDEPLRVLRRRGERVTEEVVADLDALYRSLRPEREPASIGYVTDIGFTEENVARVLELLRGVTLLVCECSFLRADVDKARVSHHLCTDDLNHLARALHPSFLLPMHLSKNYVERTQLLYDELDLPPEVTLLRLPEHVTPRPLLPREVQFSSL